MKHATLRPFRAADLDELVVLCREHADFEGATWVARADRASDLGALLDSPDACCFVVEGSNELAGYATAMLERSTWGADRFMHLDCLYLRPPYRRRGLGERLVSAVVERARALGATEVQWQTPATNLAAARFYRRLGADETAKLRFTLALGERRAPVVQRSS